MKLDTVPFCGVCADCRFWDQGGVGGHCKRYPPNGVSLDGINGYPFTSKETWCGEWQSKEIKP